MQNSRIPVTVLTGYLGAGKTTLLNRILSEKHGRKYAVVVNEFGELGIDGDLVVGADEEVLAMNNGCICCSVRGDLIRIIGDILNREQGLDGIVIETTGLARPAPVVQTFFMNREINARTRLDSIVTVADARHLRQQLIEHSEAEAQLASADLILLNKIDLLEADEIASAESLVRTVNRFAEVRRTVRSEMPIAEVLMRDAFNLKRVLEHVPDFMEDSHHHVIGVESVSIEVERPLLMERFLCWMEHLLAMSGDDILRVKGLLAFEGQDRRFVFQAVHRIADGDFFDSWPEGERRSKLVFIGRNLDRSRLLRNVHGCQVASTLRTVSDFILVEQPHTTKFLEGATINGCGAQPKR